jgi:hypothetical protein
VALSQPIDWPTVEIQLQGGERPLLLHLRPSQDARECLLGTEGGRSRAGLCSAIFDPNTTSGDSHYSVVC